MLKKACLPWCSIFSKQYEDVWASRLWVSGVLVEFGPILAWDRFPAAEEFVVISEMLAFELNADNMLEGLPPLHPGGHGVHDIQQECQICTRLTIEHFSTLKQSILYEPWPTGHDGASGPCSHMASFLRDTALVGICRWHGGLGLPTVVSGSIPGPI